MVLFAFVAKDMRLLRTLAIFTNLAFITYSTIEWFPPVLFLHLMLLPLNILRLAEIVKAPSAADYLTQAEGAVRAQTLCTDIPASGQSPAVPSPIFLSTPKAARPA